MNPAFVAQLAEAMTTPALPTRPAPGYDPPARDQGPPLNLDALAQEAANRLWRIPPQEEPLPQAPPSSAPTPEPRQQRSLADLPLPEDALPHYQQPNRPPQPDPANAAATEVYSNWRDAPPMTLEERITAATTYGGRFYLCFDCVTTCNVCGNFFGHRQDCYKNDPAHHGRTSHSQLFWLRNEGLFVWPYSDTDWTEFLDETADIRAVIGFLPTLDGVEWRPDVWRRTGAVSRRGGYVVSPHLLREAIHREDPPFTIHCSGLSGRHKTTPTLQMNGRPSLSNWYLSYCVSWNQLNKSWDEVRRWFEDGEIPFCPCPKKRGSCLNEERCYYIWCDRWDKDGIECPTAIWHKYHEKMFLF